VLTHADDTKAKRAAVQIKRKKDAAAKVKAKQQAAAKPKKKGAAKRKSSAAGMYEDYKGVFDDDADEEEVEKVPVDPRLAPVVAWIENSDMDRMRPSARGERTVCYLSDSDVRNAKRRRKGGSPAARKKELPRTLVKLNSSRALPSMFWTSNSDKITPKPAAHPKLELTVVRGNIAQDPPTVHDFARAPTKKIQSASVTPKDHSTATRLHFSSESRSQAVPVAPQAPKTPVVLNDDLDFRSESSAESSPESPRSKPPAPPAHSPPAQATAAARAPKSKASRKAVRSAAGSVAGSAAVTLKPAAVPVPAKKASRAKVLAQKHAARKRDGCDSSVASFSEEDGGAKKKQKQKKKTKTAKRKVPQGLEFTSVVDKMAAIQMSKGRGRGRT
jgi:hypothetical protein